MFFEFLDLIASDNVFQMKIQGDQDNAWHLVKSYSEYPAIPDDYNFVGDYDGIRVRGILGERDSIKSLTDITNPDSEFRKEVARLGLSVEVYSTLEERGIQEHYVLKGEDLLVAEESDYKEYHLPDSRFPDEDYSFIVEEENEERYIEIAQELGVDPGLLNFMTPDPQIAPPNGRRIYIGGYEWNFDMTNAIPSASREELIAKAFLSYAEEQSIENPDLSDLWEPSEIWNETIYAWNPVERSVVSVFASLEDTPAESCWVWDRYKLSENGEWRCVDQDVDLFYVDDKGNFEPDASKSTMEEYERYARHDGDLWCAGSVFDIAQQIAYQQWNQEAKNTPELAPDIPSRSTSIDSVETLDSKREQIKELRQTKSSVAEPSDAEHPSVSRNDVGKDEI